MVSPLPSASTWVKPSPDPCFAPWPPRPTTLVLMSNLAPCQGRVTSAPSTVPSDSGPPRWVHVSLSAWNACPTRKRAIFWPSTSTSLACWSSSSSVVATFARHPTLDLFGQERMLALPALPPPPRLHRMSHSERESVTSHVIAPGRQLGEAL